MFPKSEKPTWLQASVQSLGVKIAIQLMAPVSTEGKHDALSYLRLLENELPNGKLRLIEQHWRAFGTAMQNYSMPEVFTLGINRGRVNGADIADFESRSGVDLSFSRLKSLYELCARDEYGMSLNLPERSNLPTPVR